jgi:hypothetical protein
MSLCLQYKLLGESLGLLLSDGFSLFGVDFYRAGGIDPPGQFAN